MKRLGVIGGSGMLGSAILRGLVASGTLSPGSILVCNRSGARGDLPECIAVTTDLTELAESCDVVLWSVPPDQAPKLQCATPHALVLSVMAGISREQLVEISQSSRVIRAMSSPAAADRLAYTPWMASAGATEDDRAETRRFFNAFGIEDEVSDESHLDQFTALTGPVPGFVAFFADAMSRYAVDAGIAPNVADRAMRQLFLAAGHMLANDRMSAGDHVQEMIDYAGTTAAGLETMRDGPIRDAVAKGLAASFEKARRIGKP